MLAAIQGVLPGAHVRGARWQGQGDRQLPHGRLSAYFRAARSRFLDAVRRAMPTDYPPPSPSYPEPNEHCGVCSWDEICSKRRRADDHLSLVASITSRTRGALADRHDRQRVARWVLWRCRWSRELQGTRPEVLERVREQARDPGAGRG